MKYLRSDPDVFVSYTFSGEWQTVWTTLVVRLWYSQEFQHRELWRNAAEFASPKAPYAGAEDRPPARRWRGHYRALLRQGSAGRTEVAVLGLSTSTGTWPGMAATCST